MTWTETKQPSRWHGVLGDYQASVSFNPHDGFWFWQVRAYPDEACPEYDKNEFASPFRVLAWTQTHNRSLGWGNEVNAEAAMQAVREWVVATVEAG